MDTDYQITYTFITYFIYIYIYNNLPRCVLFFLLFDDLARGVFEALGTVIEVVAGRHG